MSHYMPTEIHYDYRPVQECDQVEFTYGEICIKCNKCGRFNKKSEPPKE